MQELQQKWKKQSANTSFPALQKRWSDEMLLKFNETKTFLRTKISKQLNDEEDMEFDTGLKGYQEMLDQLYHAKGQVEAYRQYLKQFLQFSSALGYKMLGSKRKQQGQNRARPEAQSFARMFQTIESTPMWNQEENHQTSNTTSSSSSSSSNSSNSRSTAMGESTITTDDLFNETLNSLNRKISSMESYKSSIDTRRQMRNDLDIYTRKLEFFDKNPIKLAGDEHTRVTLEAKLERTRDALSSATQELLDVFANYEIERESLLNHELDTIRQALHHFFQMGMEVTMYSLRHAKDQAGEETDKESNGSSETQEEIEETFDYNKRRTNSGRFDQIPETPPPETHTPKGASSSNISSCFGMKLPAAKDVYKMTSKYIPRRKISSITASSSSSSSYSNNNNNNNNNSSYANVELKETRWECTLSRSSVTTPSNVLELFDDATTDDNSSSILNHHEAMMMDDSVQMDLKYHDNQYT